MLTGVLVTEKYGQISPGSLNHVTRAALLLAGQCFYVEIISQISQSSLRGSPVCSRGFTFEAFCTGEIHTLTGD